MDAHSPRAQLSCEQCQRRKTRCDKTSPCSACQKAGLSCTSVQRHRLPRGRSGNSRANASVTAALRDRVIKLEAAVQRLQHREPTALPSRAEDSDGFVASGFWDELMDAVGGLREVLEGPEEELNDSSLVASPESASTESKYADGANGLLFGTFCGPIPDQTSRPSCKERVWLHDLYRERVDNLFKVLHWPTARSIIDYESPAQPSVETEALEYAVYFAAICTTLSHEVEERQSKVGRYRLATEAALIRANLLTTKSLVTLQAFILYLLGVRACQSNAQTWTLLACAVRIASAMGLDEKSSRYGSALERDTRNRVWCSIAILDVRCSLDRGSKPLLASGDVLTMPLNIDDDEISPETDHIQGHPESHYTSMSFCRMTYHAMLCQRRIMEISETTAIEKRPNSIIQAWRQQLEALAEFEKYNDDFIRLCSPNPTPFRRLAMNVSQESLISMKLLSRRPFCKQVRDSQSMPGDSFDVLATATEVIESSVRKVQSNDFVQWAWFSWPKWFALAVVLAELCGHEESELTDRAWAAAQECYGRYMHQVADTSTGLLWRPIAKLMKRASAVRNEVKSAAVNAAPPLPPHQVYAPYAQAAVDAQYTYMTDIHKADATLHANLDSSHMDTNFEGFEDMPWFNWEMFVDDLNSQDFSMSLDENFFG